jgi:DNA polymerase-3 subunit delta
MITILTGRNSFMLQQELQRIINKFVSQHTDMGLERLDGEEVEYDRIREGLQSLPFLASKKLVVLRDGSANKQFLENAEKLLKDIPESTDLVIVEPKIDKRLSYFKLLKKIGDFKEFNELDGNGLTHWLVDQAKSRGGVMTISDANLLVDRIVINQQLLANELEKLLLYNPKINKESILLLTDKTPQSSIFDLLDAALNGKTELALELYIEQRQQKVEPAQIMALLAWQLHVLALIKTAGNRDTNDIASEAKINPYVVRKSTAIADKLSYDDLKKLISYVRELDHRLKSESIDPDEALTNLFIQMSEKHLSTKYKIRNLP